MLELFGSVISESLGGATLEHFCGMVLKGIGRILEGFFNFTPPEHPFDRGIALELCLFVSFLEHSKGIGGNNLPLVVEHADDFFKRF